MDKLYRIGDFSRITSLSIKTLRFYHEKEILEPTEIDFQTGYRLYHERQIEQAELIKRLKALDFTIKEMQEIIHNAKDDQDLIETVLHKIQEVQEKVSKYQNLEQQLSRFLQYQEEAKTMKWNKEIAVKDIEDQFIAGYRYFGKYSDFGKHVGHLMKNCAGSAKGGPFSLYWNREYKEEKADIEIGVIVKKPVNKNNITSRILSGGKVYSALHKGPYERIGETYKRLLDRLAEDHKDFVLPIREIYLKGPGLIFLGNPENYLTEIQLLIKE
ncbi:MAG: MerR family transcriptional regulator [Spirochaetes bacterium]|nr:MerR family transcriptional regulator [Spirochaetota bacterium]